MVFTGVLARKPFEILTLSANSSKGMAWAEPVAKSSNIWFEKLTHSDSIRCLRHSSLADKRCPNFCEMYLLLASG